MDLSFASATALCDALRSGALSSRDLLEHCLERVERLNPRINAVVATDVEGARVRARDADDALARGESRGPLHGLPMTIKDAFEVVGMPTTSGSPELARHMAARNATAVQRLVDAGAVVFGKTNLPLMAGDMQSYNDVYGTTHNPWDPARAPGGSSGGAAAALAAGLTPLELGSDIGGSIRNPAHFCGVYGHKPSYGIVPTRGHIPGPPGQQHEPDLAVAGPMARAPEDLELALGVLAGPDELALPAWRLELPPARAVGLADFRIAAWLDDPVCPVDGEVRDRLEKAADAIERAGGVVNRSARPDVDFAEVRTTFLHLLGSVTGAGLPKRTWSAIAARSEKLDADDRGVDASLTRGMVLPHRHWLAAHETRTRLRAAWRDFFGDFDVLLCPVVPTVARPHDHGDLQGRTLSVNGETRPYWEQLVWAGLIGSVLLPATVAPVGLSSEGLPVGVQIIGPWLEDYTPLRFASLLADVTGGFSAPPGFA